MLSKSAKHGKYVVCCASRKNLAANHVCQLRCNSEMEMNMYVYCIRNCDLQSSPNVSDNLHIVDVLEFHQEFWPEVWQRNVSLQHLASRVVQTSTVHGLSCQRLLVQVMIYNKHHSLRTKSYVLRGPI